MKIRNRILAGLLSFTVVMGELLPVYAEGTDTEYAAEEAAVTGEAGDGTDTEPADEEGAEEVLSKETDAAGDYAFVPGYIELPEDEEVTILNTDKSYRELRSALVEGDAEEEYYYSAEADRASATDRAFPYSYTKEASITDYFNTYFPPARNQNPFGSCWAHSAMSLGEFYLATHGKLSDRTAVDFSELHMAWFCNTQGTPSLAGDTGDKVSFYYSSINEKLYRGGNLRFAAQTLAQGRGFVDESVAPYPEYKGNISYQDVSVTTPAASTERLDSAYLTCSYEISTEDVEQLKQAVISNGIVGVSLFWDDVYYNSEHNSYICTDRTKTNHAVCIVGWDDDFPAAAFGGQASRNGAWLIRNSWNFLGEMDTLSSYCYFWLSYDDTSLSDIAWVFEADTESYDNHYFYDSEPHGENAFGYGEGANCYSANVYRAQGNEGGSELLEAVGFSIKAVSSSGTDYELQVYTDLAPGGDPSTGTLHEASVTGGTIYFNGYYTVELKEAVPLEEGEYYAVVLKRTDGYSATVEGATYMTNGFSVSPGAQSGQSFYSSNARSWTDSHSTGKYNFVLGAYTTNVSGSGDRSSLKLNPASLSLEIGMSGSITATVKDRDGNIDSSAEVSFESSDSTVAVVTVIGQQATVEAVKSGKATITATYGSHTAKCQVTVRAKEERIPAIIVLDKTALSFTAADQSEKLTATVTDTNNRVITDPQLNFESRDSGVATVDEDGNVRPVATGATSILVSCGNAYASCSVAVALTGVRTEAPIADPESGSKVAVGDTIRLSCAMSKAKIYYTTDGSDPDESSLLYKDKIVVPESAPGTVFTVKAMTVAEGYAASSVEEFVYTVVEDVPLAQTAAPTADPASGTKLSVGDTISLSCETEGAKIFYTTDGTEAGEASALYGKPIAVTADMAGMTLTIRAIALAEGYEASEEQSFSYTVKEIPKPGPESGPSPMDPVPHVTEDQAFYLVKGQKLDVTGEGIPVIFDMSGAIALAKNGIVTAKKEGKAVLRVGQGRYDIIVVEPALSQTLVKLVPGETETLYVSRSCYGAELSAQYPVYWVSSAPAVASVTPDGEIRALSKGSATITAYVNGKAYKCKVKVADTEKPALSVESREEAVTLSAVTLQPLQSYTLKLKGLSFKNRTWYSEDGKLKLKYDGKKNVYESRTVRIDEKGKITAIGSGSCVVCFKDEYDTEYRLPLNVAEPVERVLYLNSGKSRKLKFYGVKNSTAVFRSEYQNVAKVDSKGTVKAFKAGETTVSCTYGNFTFITHVYTEYAALETGDGLYQDGDQYHYQLRIRKGSEPYSLRFRMGDDYYGVYQSVLFASNKNEIAFVDENGRVEARKSGNALITAKVNGKKITIKVTVTP